MHNVRRAGACVGILVTMHVRAATARSTPAGKPPLHRVPYERANMAGIA